MGSWNGQTTWWQTMWENPRYSMPPSSWSLLLRFALSNPRSLWPLGKSGARETCPLEEDSVMEHLSELTHIQFHRPWWDVPTSAEGAGCYRCGTTLNHLWKVMVTEEGSCSARGKKLSLWSPRLTWRRTWETAGLLTSPQCLERWWSKSSWKAFQNISKTSDYTQVDVVNINLWRAIHALSTWHPFKTKLQMDNVRPDDAVYLDFSKGFGTVFHIILSVKLMNRLDKWTMRTENRLNFQDWREVISNTKSDPVINAVTQGSNTSVKKRSIRFH